MRPFVTLNQVQSLDGATSDAQGRSVGLGSPTDRLVMDLLRSEADLVACGAATVRADDPWLHLRTPEARAWRERRRPGGPQHPHAAVLQRTGTISDASRCLMCPPGVDSATLPPLWLVTSGAGPAQEEGGAGAQAQLQAEASVERRAVESWAVADGSQGLGDFLERAYVRGVRHVVLEGGARLAAAFFAADFIDEVFVTVAPVWHGTARAATPSGVHALELIESVRVHHELFTRWRVATPERGPRPPLLNATWLADRLDALAQDARA